MRILMILLLFCSSILSFSQDDVFYSERAQEAFDLGDFETALKDIDRSILLKPGNLEYNEFKGNCLFFLQDLQASYDVMNFVLESDSTSWVAYECIGAIFDMTGEFDLAVEYLTTAIRHAPNDSTKVGLYCNRAASYIRTREFQKGYDDLILAHHIEPTNIYVLTNLGGVCDEVGKGDETLKYLRMIVDIDPTFYPAYINIGFKYQEMGEYEKAIDYLNQAIAIEPNDAFCYSNRSFNKMRLGDLKGAMKDINKSIELNPTNSYAYKNRALIHLEKNKTEKACEDLQLAVDNGFPARYGPEVEELQKEHCSK